MRVEAYEVFFCAFKFSPSFGAILESSKSMRRFVTLVSSQRMTSEAAIAFSARREISSRLPIGVGISVSTILIYIFA